MGKAALGRSLDMREGQKCTGGASRGPPAPGRRKCGRRPQLVAAEAVGKRHPCRWRACRTVDPMLSTAFGIW